MKTLWVPISGIFDGQLLLLGVGSLLVYCWMLKGVSFPDDAIVAEAQSHLAALWVLHSKLCICIENRANNCVIFCAVGYEKGVNLTFTEWRSFVPTSRTVVVCSLFLVLKLRLELSCSVNLVDRLVIRWFRKTAQFFVEFRSLSFRRFKGFHFVSSKLFIETTMRNFPILLH